MEEERQGQHDMKCHRPMIGTPALSTTDLYRRPPPANTPSPTDLSPSCRISPTDLSPACRLSPTDLSPTCRPSPTDLSPACRLATNELDGKIELKLPFSTDDTTSFLRKDVWLCRVFTGNSTASGTNARVYITVYGDKVRMYIPVQTACRTRVVAVPDEDHTPQRNQ